jgi:hypothetical protein
MGDMNVHLVMAVIAIAGARTRHELGLGARLLELDDLAQIDQSLLALARASARSRTPASLMNPSASA